MKKTKSAWLNCGLVTVALIATPALADTAVDAPAVQADDSTTEILVTARKRTEALQDVPMSVSVVGSTELDRRNVRNVNSLFAEVPGLFMAPASASASS